ncbi:MAG: sulfite exporter TauE/SafE family protein [Defluviitaleaceae bacterium]|nr:sulfite exporter TauE/SafE family protein [Defluviitaleaceae bacterium]
MKKSKLTIPIGLVVGLANGLFGAGGGTLLVPSLEKLLKFETHKAHATAIAVILPLCVISAFIYIWGVDVDWKVVGLVSSGGVVGGVIGAKLLKRFTAAWLNITFGVFLAVGATRMLFS